MKKSILIIIFIVIVLILIISVGFFFYQYPQTIGTKTLDTVTLSIEAPRMSNPIIFHLPFEESLTVADYIHKAADIDTDLNPTVNDQLKIVDLYNTNYQSPTHQDWNMFVNEVKTNNTSQVITNKSAEIKIRWQGCSSIFARYCF